MTVEYAAFRTVGSPQTAATKIRKAVRTLRLQSDIPLIKFERRAGRRRGEFYFFIGVETDASGERSRIPDAVSDVSRMSGFRGPAIDQLFTAEQIEQMVARQDVETDSTHPFVDHYADILCRLDRSRSWTGLADDAASEPDDHRDEADALLRWLSCCGAGSMQTLESAGRAIGLIHEANADGWGNPFVLASRLSLTGHLELMTSPARWAVAPPTIVRSLEESSYGWLVGARTNQVMESVAAIASVHESRPDPTLPSRVELNGIPAQSEVAAAGFLESTAERIAELLPDLATWIGRYRRLETDRVGGFEAARWEGAGLGHAEELPATGIPEAPGVYRLRSPSRRSYTFGLFSTKGEAWIVGEKFALLHWFRHVDAEAIGPASLLWLPERREVTSHKRDRLPPLYERALVLCECRPPVWRGDMSAIVYHGVAESVVGIVADRLQLDVLRD